ncbi:MAG: hypothetical protein IJZ85_10225 [Lachnospiraceae bacterium]|nr:hypothetical protein [Lachnospiraceae bacterium]
MRRSDEEFKAELMLRVKDYRGKQLRRRKAWSAAATLAACMVITVVLNIPKIGAETESMRENSSTLDVVEDVAQKNYPTGELQKGPGTGTQTTTHELYSDVGDIAEELPEYVVGEIATAETGAAVKDVPEADVSETDGNADADMAAGSQIRVDASVSETVQIRSVSVKTEQGEHESEAMETITRVITFLANIQRMNADQSFMTSESLSESEPEEELTGSPSDWQGDDDADPTKAVQEYAAICHLTLYYADGSTYNYELHQGEAFWSVMGDGGAEMSLTAKQWEQLEALLETVLAE